MPLCLTQIILSYESRVSGVIQRKKYHLSHKLGVVAIEKRAFGSLSTMVGQLTMHTHIYIYIYIYIEWLVGFFGIPAFVDYLKSDSVLFTCFRHI